MARKPGKPDKRITYFPNTPREFIGFWLITDAMEYGIPYWDMEFRTWRVIDD